MSSETHNGEQEKVIQDVSTQVLTQEQDVTNDHEGIGPITNLLITLVGSFVCAVLTGASLAGLSALLFHSKHLLIDFWVPTIVIFLAECFGLLRYRISHKDDPYFDHWIDRK